MIAPPRHRCGLDHDWPNLTLVRTTRWPDRSYRFALLYGLWELTRDLYIQSTLAEYIIYLLGVNMSSTTETVPAATKLRELLAKKDEIVVCPGVYDGFTARIALATGFDSLYMVDALSHDERKNKDRKSVV